jgi:hypothetical protein
LSQAVITLTAPLYSTNECLAKETLVQPGLTCPARSSLPFRVQFLVRDYPRVTCWSLHRFSQTTTEAQGPNYSQDLDLFHNCCHPLLNRPLEFQTISALVGVPTRHYTFGAVYHDYSHGDPELQFYVEFVHGYHVDDFPDPPNVQSYYSSMGDPQFHYCLRDVHDYSTPGYQNSIKDARAHHRYCPSINIRAARPSKRRLISHHS